MNVRIMVFFIICFFYTNIYGQKPTTVIAKEVSIGKESGMGFKTSINRAEKKTIVKEWKFLLKGYDCKAVVKESVVYAEGVQIESMGSDPLVVTAEIISVNETEHDFSVLFYKNGQYVNSTTDLSAFTAAKAIVRMFANKLSQEATNNHKKKETKLFDNLTSSLEKLKREQEKAERLVKNAEEEIKAAEQLIKNKTKELAENKEKQAETEKKVEKQKLIVKKANAEADLYK